MELRERVAGLTRAAVAPQGELYNGFGEGLSRAFELALTPAIIGGLGYLLDRWLGLLPLFTIVFFLVAMVGLIARMWYGYDARMKEHESAGPWARAAPAPGTERAAG
ncbi:MAG: AtpZ/AtpI family protein [Actinomycetota bacterium]|nr:AtpZ/AtpI family protein [Actinomycetota bacterium]